MLSSTGHTPWRPDLESQSEWGITRVLLRPGGGPVSGAPAAAVKLRIERSLLSNGLTLLVAEDHTTPTLCYMTYFRVGSRNERPGITGISHLFEHMMFNGSERFGPSEFDRLIESSGGHSNGSTWYDYTNYHEEVASENIETVLELESDRMRSLLITPENLEQERSIVKEERRLRTDNSTEGKVFEVLMSNAFTASPYRWPVVGWERDLDNISIEDCREYFRTYYAPNNAIVVIVGDVDPSETARLMEHHFGPIPRQAPPRAVVDAEPEQKGEKRIIHRMMAELPAIMAGFKAPSYADPRYAAMEVIRSILTDGESSRLYRALIYEKQMATDAYAFFRPSIDTTLMVLYAQAKQETRVEDLESALEEVLAGLTSGGVTAEEVLKARNQIRSEVVREMKDCAGTAERIGFFELLTGDHDQMNAMLEKVDAVTPEDVTRAAREFLVPDRRTVVTLIPESRP